MYLTTASRSGLQKARFLNLYALFALGFHLPTFAATHNADTPVISTELNQPVSASPSITEVMQKVLKQNKPFSVEIGLSIETEEKCYQSLSFRLEYIGDDHYTAYLSQYGTEIVSIGKLDDVFYLNNRGKESSADSLEALQKLCEGTEEEAQLMILLFKLLPPWLLVGKHG